MKLCLVFNGLYFIGTEQNNFTFDVEVSCKCLKAVTDYSVINDQQ